MNKPYCGLYFKLEPYMTSQNFINLNNYQISSTDEEYSIPLNISEIIFICKEFNKLGINLQNQVENLLEFGVEESIKNGFVKQQSLPLIKNFLNLICENQYFGDAASQAKDCIKLINAFEDKYKIIYCSKSN